MDKKASENRPDLLRRLFWEFRYEEIDWQKEHAAIQKEHAAIIERVIERGTEEEWKELIRFYGIDRVGSS